jgi:glycerol uptake facilitator-like aquaporin
MDKNLRAYMAELFGTFVVVFVSAGAVCVNQLAAVSWLHPPLAKQIEVKEPGTIAVEQLVVVQPQPGLAGIALAAGLIYAAALAFTAISIPP